MPRPTVNATVRTATGKGHNRRLRAAEKLPAVVYGKGKDPVAIVVDPKQIALLLNGEYGRNTVCNLAVDGEGASRTVIFKDYQVHPWKRTLVHVDFHEIAEDAHLVLDIPFKKAGRAAIEKIGGRARVTRRYVRVRCRPDHVPAAIEYDVSDEPMESLGILVSQVTMPEGVEAVFKQDYKVIQFKAASAEPDEDEEGEGEGEGEETAAEAEE